MPIKVTAIVSVKPGKDENFIVAARSCVAASRREPGVLRYDLWRETEGERRFVFDELYIDQASLREHAASDHFKAINLAARDLTTSPPTLIVTQSIDVDAS